MLDVPVLYNLVKSFIPTKLFCISVRAPLFLYLLPYLYQFSIVEDGTNLVLISHHNFKDCVRTALSNCTFWMKLMNKVNTKAPNSAPYSMPYLNFFVQRS